MSNKIYIISLLVFLSISFTALIINKTNTNNNTFYYKERVFKTNSGFGYSITYKGKLIIKQDFIPSIQKKHPFCSYKDAESIANLVKEKLYKKENPKISLEELKRCKIKLNCIN